MHKNHESKWKDKVEHVRKFTTDTIINNFAECIKASATAGHFGADQEHLKCKTEALVEFFKLESEVLSSK